MANIGPAERRASGPRYWPRTVAVGIDQGRVQGKVPSLIVGACDDQGRIHLSPGSGDRSSYGEPIRPYRLRQPMASIAHAAVRSDGCRLSIPPLRKARRPGRHGGREGTGIVQGLMMVDTDPAADRASTRTAHAMGIDPILTDRCSLMRTVWHRHGHRGGRPSAGRRVADAVWSCQPLLSRGLPTRAVAIADTWGAAYALRTYH
jgi:hypothetical protein